MPRTTPMLFALVMGCGAAGGPSSPAPAPPPTPPRDPVSIATTDTDQQIGALRPVARIPGETGPLDRAIESHFETVATRRSYIMTDKPLYQPGETIWFRVDLRATKTLAGGPPIGLSMQLTSPRGAIVATRRVLAQGGVARNDFPLAPELEGGEYTIHMTADDGSSADDRKVIVNTYEAPRLMKTLEFVRKAYGEGDAVSAALELKRATGEAFAERALTGVVSIDDVEVERISIRTDKQGKAVARFTLPATMARGDGLLTVLAEDGGVTESIQKRIPIVMNRLQFSVFPEGGDLVDTIPGRVYFAARTLTGKPADVEGKVVDDRGQTVTTWRSVHDGMGRFELTPMPDRRYRVEITKPAGIAATYAIPAAQPGGCVIRSVDPGPPGALRVGAICNTSRRVLVEAVVRERRLAGAAFELQAGEPALLELPADAAVQGVARVTLFSTRHEPLAERLVYHGDPRAGGGLRVSVTAHKQAYSPRDPVKLTIRTEDAQGKPVKASVGVAVVDETVLSFADDKSARLLAHVLLEQELGGGPIEEPNFYFSDKPEAAAGLDALLATHGFRRFEWRPIVAQTQGAQP